MSAAHPAARDNSSLGREGLGKRGRERINDQVLWREKCSISSNTMDFDVDLRNEQDAVNSSFPAEYCG